MKIDLSGKIALVTGAAGELGRVIALTLAECGADVAVHYHGNKNGAELLRDKILKLGRRAIIVQADITEQESVSAMRDSVERELGAPDIIVNNAVSQYQWKHILEQDLADYEDQFRSCVLQNVLMAKTFVPAMIKKNYGRVVAINTECAMQNFPTQSAYVAGKRGMDGVLRILAKEVGAHGITVNQVAPGWTISDRDRAANSERQPEYEKLVPLGRRGTDQDIANAVAFLASDLASFISGVYLPVSGGSVMPGI
ncbi:MAG: SDR family oxidoreductase [Verrucomicrobiales bacterium]|jgi:3-oxoacyl-[acyl-carrier protein] reductase|nr:SDR family oxidoreductase [Verrucomicrobiales bacterium]